ncbi:PREDICTED: G8 domain-containing protein DDB_G0286311-like [Camelina sativa]|uniref:G8 domain-containing protein DDB_G0286311-like n=1 Tax=Camelina sativa TaxID=90675 RepID=A0ABM0T197_CAMSA|nr:PREDICTED: G8 domain-containing protein DDB_G0286311-like [Camelina sativa]
MDEHDAENARRDEEQRLLDTQMAGVVSYMKEKDPAYAALVATQQPPPATTTPNTAPANDTTAISLTVTSPETAPRTIPATFEMLHSYMKEKDPAFAAFLATQQPPPATTTPNTAPANDKTAIPLTAPGTSPETAPRTTPATASTNLPLSNTSSSTSPAS